MLAQYLSKVQLYRSRQQLQFVRGLYIGYYGYSKRIPSTRMDALAVSVEGEGIYSGSSSRNIFPSFMNYSLSEFVIFTNNKNSSKFIFMMWIISTGWHLRNIKKNDKRFREVYFFQIWLALHNLCKNVKSVTLENTFCTLYEIGLPPNRFYGPIEVEFCITTNDFNYHYKWGLPRYI